MKEAFNKFASKTAETVAHAWFFMFCVALIAIWLPSLFLIRNVDTWQLIINTATTIITFLLVALLHNDQHRFENATNQRLTELLEKLEGAMDPVIDEGQKP